MDSQSPRVLTMAVPAYRPRNEPPNPAANFISRKPRMRVFRNVERYSFTIPDDDDVDTSFLDSDISDDDDTELRARSQSPNRATEIIDLLSSDDEDDECMELIDLVSSDDDNDNDSFDGFRFSNDYGEYVYGDEYDAPDNIGDDLMKVEEEHEKKDLEGADVEERKRPEVESEPSRKRQCSYQSAVRDWPKGCGPMYRPRQP